MSDSQVVEKQLVQSIRKNLTNGKISEARLQTDERVIARITDGIYRQPASALRELIANAYDADASNVYIQTDAPRFNKISIRDDGNGLTVEALARLIHHIGGSAKRNADGVKLGITNESDPSLSPKGRRLIGKIGIGLFSVAQLTRHFQIITKTAGTNYRLVAEVILKTYSEDEASSPEKRLEDKAKDGELIETGSVRIKSISAEDAESHGTEIILLDLRPQTREMLQSKQLWLQVDAGNDPDSPELQADRQIAPIYHIGRLALGSDDQYEQESVLPWEKRDLPEQRFAKLYQAIVEEVDKTTSNPRLETVLDNYLRMLWTLSLSAPLDYIEKHPFDLTNKDHPKFFALGQNPKGQASQLSLGDGERLRDKLQLRAPERGADLPFRVVVDSVELRRPLRFNGLPSTSQAIDYPIVFAGTFQPDLSKVPADQRGGGLELEAYFLWAPRIVPKENIGVLVRIADASGTLFDETFMKYQIAELQRLRQISGEIFVRRGLDSALNIDRESFNYAHPHYQLTARWVHRVLKQIANTLKKISSDILDEKRRSSQEQRQEKVDKIAHEAIARLQKQDEYIAPEVVFTDPVPQENLFDTQPKRKQGALVFDSGVIFADVPEPDRLTKGIKGQRTLLQKQMAAVARILDAYGVFEDMPYQRQQELLRSIAAVFTVREEDPNAAH